MKLLRKWSFEILALSFFSLRLVSLKDVSFLADEYELIKIALEHNTLGTMATHSLMGTRGFSYGPLVVWIYQTLLLMSHNIYTLFLLKILLTSCLEFWALCRFRKLFPDWPIICFLLPLMSPYLWQYSRMLWDNPFNIPISLLILSFTLSFVRVPKKGPMIGWVLLSFCSLLIHLMALPIVFSCALLVLYFQRNWLIKNILLLGATVLLGLSIAGPYLNYLFRFELFAGQRPLNQLTGDLRWKFIEGAVFGPRVLGSLGFRYFTGDQVPLTELPFVHVYGVFSLVLAIFFLAGLIRLFRSSSRQSPTADPHAFAFLRVFFVTNLAFCFITRQSIHPHYFNASWCFFWLQICFELTTFFKSRETFSRTITPFAVMSGFFMVANLLYFFHQHSGTRHSQYGPTLSNLVSLTDRLIEQNIDPIRLNCKGETLCTYRAGMRVLSQLRSRQKENLNPSGIAPNLVYMHPQDPLDGRIDLE